MATAPDHGELHHYVGDMVLMERQILALVGAQLLPQTAGHPRLADAVERYHRMAATQRETLEERLRSLGGETPCSPTRVVPLPVLAAVDMGDDGTPNVSKMLHVLYTAFNHATLGYAMLHAVAHRFYDSQVGGNTALWPRRICADMRQRHKKSTR